MMQTEQILSELLDSPRLNMVLDELQKRVNSEQQKRIDFYNSITESDKVEFINGEIIFHSPVKLHHNDASGLLYMLLKTYVQKHDLGFVGIEKIMISLTRNDYEPDICFFNKAKADVFTPDQMRFPAPDFIVEILSDRTANRDRGIKFEDYAAHGVAEYWIIASDTSTVEQYILNDDSYELKQKSDTGILRSIAISGFEIPVQAIFEADVNLSTLQRILATD